MAARGPDHTQRGHLKVAPCLVLALCTTAGCGSVQREVHPEVSPTSIPLISPPIHARARLLIPSSFEAYLVEERVGIENWRTRLGETATRALSALVTKSFAAAGTSRLGQISLGANTH
jgi:hypothetical protein